MMPAVFFEVKMAKTVGIDILKDKIVCGFIGVDVEPQSRIWNFYP
jgi:hypothetical protein